MQVNLKGGSNQYRKKTEINRKRNTLKQGTVSKNKNQYIKYSKKQKTSNTTVFIWINNHFLSLLLVLCFSLIQKRKKARDCIRLIVVVMVQEVFRNSFCNLLARDTHKGHKNVWIQNVFSSVPEHLFHFFLSNFRFLILYQNDLLLLHLAS